jgi:UDP-N-acetylglucosamine 2-epimerase (non-hydrolysing)
MKIVSVVGARPNFMKIAPIADAIAVHNAGGGPAIEHLIVHTGQHYDQKMSDLFFQDLGIPEPDINLGVGSGSHAMQTARVMAAFEPVLIKYKPDYVLVVGDVNSTLACALVAVKNGIKVIHVEAGLRSFDRTMPEEINRVVTDAISDILFTTERAAEANLLREGVAIEKIHFVGNVMIDTLLKHRQKAEQSCILQKLGLTVADGASSAYGVVTLHRPSNVDDNALLQDIFAALNELAAVIPLIFPIHPRTQGRITDLDISLSSRLKLIDPLGYLDFLKLMAHAWLVLTDSGGIQEETTVLGIPCLTLRENTERPVTVKEGTNQLVPIERHKIVATARGVLTNGLKKGKMPELWDGDAAERIIKILTGGFGFS